MPHFPAPPPPCLPQAHRLLEQMSAARRRQRSVALRLESLNLTEAQLLLLWAIESATESGTANREQISLAHNLGISPAQVSGLVEQLRLRACLICERTAADRRRQECRLTPAGSELLQQALQVLAEMESAPTSQTQTREAA